MRWCAGGGHLKALLEVLEETNEWGRRVGLREERPLPDSLRLARSLDLLARQFVCEDDDDDDDTRNMIMIATNSSRTGD